MHAYLPQFLVAAVLRVLCLKTSTLLAMIANLSVQSSKSSNHPQGYFVHRYFNNVWYNKAHSLIGKPYFSIIASNYKQFIQKHCEYFMNKYNHITFASISFFCKEWFKLLKFFLLWRCASQEPPSTGDSRSIIFAPLSSHHCTESLRPNLIEGQINWKY